MPRELLLAGLVVVGLAICVAVFWPAIQGKDAAQRGVGGHFLVLGAIVSVLTLNALFTLPFADLLRDQSFTLPTFALAALATQVPVLLVVFGRLIWPRAVTAQELGLRSLPLDRIVRVGLAMGLFGLVLTIVVELLLSQLGLRPNQFEEFTFIRGGGPLGLAVVLFFAAVSAPFSEELFFRGFIFGLYRRRQPLWLAYLISGLLFTAAHLMPMRMNLQQMAGLAIGIFVLGTLLAWTYQRTGSLYPGMLAHALNNATGLTLLYLVPTPQ